MGTFITNNSEHKTLKERLKTLIEKSSELKFLVGFFYFSGIKELYETLKNLYENGKLKKGHIKILVGLDVDKGVYGIYEISKKDLKEENPYKLKDDFFSSLKNAFNSSDLDKEEIYEQVDFFIKLLEEGMIELKKTRTPNHSKLYLFKMDESIRSIIPNLFITGSSNLTRAGIEGQNEFNVEIKDYGFTEAEEYFDKLWQKAIEIKQEDVRKIIKTLKQESFLKEITPFTAYAYLLKIYIEIHEGKIYTKNLENILKENGYNVYSYQLDAVSQGISNCYSHGGTIIADVVGLGKSVIACLIANALNKRGIVICPPHLIGDENRTSGWKKYLADFKLWNWEVRSIGKLEETLKFVQDNPDIEVVIVDEAHRFRNERTKQYHILREICRGKTVILLTATPFNNRPSDIFSLVKLFNIPKKSTITLDEDLESKFTNYENEFKKLTNIKNNHNTKDEKKKKKVINDYQSLFGESNIDLKKVKERIKKLAKEIRAILEPVVIRRNRLDLQYYPEKIELSKVKDPIEWFFELNKDQLRFYDEVINAFKSFEEGGRFTGAIYFPIRYEKKSTELSKIIDEFESSGINKDNKEENFIYLYQKNLYNFMRRLLVKRFESSFGAFKESIRRFKEINQKNLEFIKKTGKFVLDRKLIEEIADEDIDEIEEELKSYEESLKKDKINKEFYKVYEISKFKRGEDFIRDIENDVKLFEELEKKIEEVGLIFEDPKAKRLIQGIKEFLKEKRKVIIFTEYSDTAKYLESILKKEFGDRVLTAFGNLSQSIIKALYENFDAQYKEPKDNYDILVATDKLSEGFNLNRAGVVINYDIPWNPVRVIQRVGRINRIGKKVYDEIYIVNFFPTEKGVDIVKSREIATTKMFMIHQILGEDAKIFEPDEEPQASELYKRLNIYSEGEEESFLTRLRKIYDQIISSYPNIEKSFENLPHRIKTAKNGEKNEILVFIKKGEDLFVGYKSYDEKKPRAVSFEDVYEKIVAKPEEKALPLSKDFWENYYIVLNKSEYKFNNRTNPNELNTKAFNLLNTLFHNNCKNLTAYCSFISKLIEDLKHYGTLSEYAVSEIVKWEKYLDDEKKLIDAIENLKNEIGENFLEKVLKSYKNISEEVIISIENQAIGGQM